VLRLGGLDSSGRNLVRRDARQPEERDAARLERLPAVSEARVETLLPDAVKVTLVEKVAAVVWQTSAVRLLGAADGTLILLPAVAGGSV